MAYQPYVAYIVAWDWLLWALYALIGICIALGIAAVAIVEISEYRAGKSLAETNQPKE